MNINPAAQQPPTRLAAVLALVALAALGAPSAGSAQSPDEQQIQQLCESIESFARVVMEARQAGVSMAEIMERAAEQGFPEEIHNLNRSLIVEAYERQQFLYPSNQKEAAEDFANDVALACYQGLSN